VNLYSQATYCMSKYVACQLYRH